MSAKGNEDRTTDVNEILRRYQAGDRDFQGANVPEDTSLRGVNLAGANFSESWLSCVDFKDADLRGVCFDACNVKCSDFRGADLSGASFRGALVCGALIDGRTKLDHVATEGATYYGAPVDDLRKLISEEKS